MNNLYIEKYYKEKDYLDGMIYNRPVTHKLDCLNLYYTAKRIGENIYELYLYKYSKGHGFKVTIDETMDGRMNMKNILYYVKNHLNMILGEVND